MPDLSIQQSRGGQYNRAFAGGATTTLVHTGPGRIQRFAITTAGTASAKFYDGTQVTGATLLFTSLTNDPLGTVKECDFPVSNGIVIEGTTGTAGLCLFFNKKSAGQSNGD